MGAPGLALLWVVGTSSVATSSVADSAVVESSTAAIDVGDVPLSPEDLALLAAFATATSSEAAPPPPVWASPSFDGSSTRTITRARLVETGARSIHESLQTLPVIGWTRRPDFSAGIYDGVELEPLGYRVSAKLPHFIDAISLPRSGGLGVSRADGTIVYAGRAPAALFSSEAAAFLRSADRSSGLFGTVTGGVGPVAARLSLAYGDFSARRAPATPFIQELGAPYQVWNFSGRAAYHGDGFRLLVGGDLDRGLNLASIFQGRLVARTETLQTHMVFVSGIVESGAAEAGLVLSGQGIRSDTTFFSGGGPSIGHTDFWQARGWATWRTFDALELRGGALLSGAKSANGVAQPDVRIEPWLGVGLHLGALDAQLTGRGYRWDYSPGDFSRRDEPLVGAFVEASAECSIVGPLAWAASIRSGVGEEPLDFVWLFANPRPRVETGPRLRVERGWVELTAFYASYRVPMELGLARDIDVEVRGGELEGALSIGRWTFAGAAALSDDRAEGERSRDPDVRAIFSLRHDFLTYGAYAEGHARVGGAWAHVARPEAPTDPYLAFGISGGLVLGAGLTFRVALENGLDAEIRVPNSTSQEPGIDLRTSLEWAY